MSGTAASLARVEVENSRLNTAFRVPALEFPVLEID